MLFVHHSWPLSPQVYRALALLLPQITYKKRLSISGPTGNDSAGTRAGTSTLRPWAPRRSACSSSCPCRRQTRKPQNRWVVQPQNQLIYNRDKGPWSHVHMTSAKFSGFLTPSPLVCIWVWFTVYNSRNLPYYIWFWVAPLPPPSAVVICTCPLMSEVHSSRNQIFYSSGHEIKWVQSRFVKPLICPLKWNLGLSLSIFLCKST